MSALPSVPIKFDVFALQGGLDLHTPQLKLPPGAARDALNWECSINGGYSRIPGYERFDGRPSPTAAVVGTLALSAVAGIAVGDTVNGQTSGATGVVAYIDGTTVAYTKLTGSFSTGENLRKVTTVIGVINTVGVSGLSQTQQATYRLGGAGIYRADIQSVPGSGPVRGVFTWSGSIYALRNNAGGTALALYKSSAGGWTLVNLGYELYYNTGTGTAIKDGDTVTGGTSGATGVVARVAAETGGALWTTTGWSGGSGRLILSSTTGTFLAGEALNVSGTGRATCVGAATATTLLPNGRVETHTGNAGLGSRVYGCDGVNRGWEFDGATFVPIRTGMAADKPTHVHVHKKHLFFSFGPSAQHASITLPYQWSPVSGAAELAVDQAITAFVTLPGDTINGAMAITTNDILYVLYGTAASGSTPWQLTALNANAGCKAYGAQVLSDAFLFDDTGIVSLTAVKQFGNFTTDSLTMNLRSWVQARRTSVTASMVNVEKSQFRVYFNDGYALYATIADGRLMGAMPMLFPVVFNVCCNGESTNGAEVSYVGGNDGFVYRLDIGTSFDGATIDHRIELAFAFQGAARVRKRYRKAVFELQGTGYAEFSAGWTLAYGDEDVVQSQLSAKTTGVYWDEFTWDEFVWDGRSISPSQMSIEGSGENISIRIEGSSALWESFTVNSVTLQYTPRRVMR